MSERESNDHGGRWGWPVRRGVRGRVVLLGLVLAPGVFLAALMLSQQILGRMPQEAAVPWAVVGLLTVLGALVLLGGVWHLVFHWRRPLCRLCGVLELIGRGEAPIEELSQVRGAHASLVPALREILHDWRLQRAQLAELEAEMQQRVASRTDALERMIGTLRQQARRDPLTGLFNRRMLEQHLPEIIEQHRENRLPLCVLMMDLDHFKSLNDELGHAAGDQMLRSVAQLIRSTIRERDWAFRCGGDEFLAVLPGCVRARGEALADRLASLVDGVARPLRLPQAVRLSVGVAMLEEVPGGDATALLKEADRRLYAVKVRNHGEAKSGRVGG